MRKSSIGNFLLQLLILTVLTSVASKSFAQIQLGQAIMQGTGCPQGTATAVLSPTNDTISILFSAFQIEKQPQDPTNVSLSKNCKVLVPVTLSQGYDLNAYQLDYRGYLHLEDPKGSFLFRSMPLVNPRIPAQPKDMYIQGVYDGELNFSHVLDTYRLNQCGGTFNLQFELTLGVFGQTRIEAPQGAVIASVDSVDGSVPSSEANGIHLKIGLVQCQPQPTPTPLPRPGWPGQPGWPPRPGWPQPPVRPIPQPPVQPQPPISQPPVVVRPPVVTPPVIIPQQNPGQCYLNRYPDICINSPKNYCKDPAKHYREHGQSEGRIWGCQ